MKYMTKKLLAEAIEIGERHNYNRQLKTEILDVIREAELLPLDFVMIHCHRMGEPYPPHARCRLMATDECGQIGFMGFIDIPLDFYDRLPGDQNEIAA